MLSVINISGKDVLPLVEGGKGISISTGKSSGAWANALGVGTFSAVNADQFDEDGNLVPVLYHGKTRKERHFELIDYAIKGGITQAKIAHEIANGKGALHMNVLWEMGGVEPILEGVLEQTKGLVHGVTCGAGMPFKLAQICSKYGVFYYPIVSSARAFKILFKRAYSKFQEFLGGVVYEDPWLAGGHNGLSNSEDPSVPQPPYPRVLELRKVMREIGVKEIPIFMAGGVWRIDEWKDFINNPDLGPIAFQFGTRPLLTKESPISDKWKKRLLTLKKGDIILNKFSPTGFYSSAVRNNFLKELEERSNHQIPYSISPYGELSESFQIGARNRNVYVAASDKIKAIEWMSLGYKEALRTPESTLIFVTTEKANEILQDQTNCMGCLSACVFSNWSQHSSPELETKRPDPRSFCIQKTLQEISHGGDIEKCLMFAGHQAYRFAEDPFYSNGFIPTVQELIDRICLGK